ncbi:MAG: pilus assembly protein [Rhodospirillales bacterium]|nr:pilus assembly protein [Rhodospirillales bacterium]
MSISDQLKRKKTALEFFSRFVRDMGGTIAIAFAVMLPVIVGAAGMSLDLAQAHLVGQRLGGALDAAALAATASETDPVAIEARVQEFFNANYPEDRIGSTYNLDVTIDGDDVIVSAYADYDTSFIRILGIDNVTIYKETTVRKETKGLEVVLVLDNTGSMSSNNNISALRTASTNFIGILFDSVEVAEDVKIGLVPYSSSVRIGRYGLGMNPDGTQYGDGSSFVTLPADMSYTTDKTSSNWYGCVVEHKDTGYNSAATYVSNSRGQLWKDGSSWDGHGWDPGSGSNDPYDDDVLDNYSGPWDVYSYGRVISNGQKCSSYSGYSNTRCSDCTGSYGRCNSSYCFCWKSDYSGGTNYNCPYAYIQPLTSDEQALYDVVNDMQAHGYTYGNIGMTWGYRLLSPEVPFTEGDDWDSERWQKVIVMMTDGDNTMESTYSTYWDTRKHDITVPDMNDRFAETCEALKDLGVTIYTITFTSNIDEGTKDYYRNCASSSSQYYDAPAQEDLIQVFETISRELANLHIKS